MILQEGLNASTLKWRAVVYDAIEGIRNFLISALEEDFGALARVAELSKENVELAQPTVR